MSEWHGAEKVADYRSRAATIPHRTEGEAVLVEVLPERVERVLDLGCGDGRLAGIVREARPESLALGLDFSAPMLQAARERFMEDGAMQFMRHDLAEPLPALGRFQLVVSSFAIHHLEHKRKRELYGEVLSLLDPGGVFLQPRARQLAHRGAARAVPRDPRGPGGSLQ